MLAPFRLVATLLSVLVVGAPLAAIAFFVVAIVGEPGTCESEDRPIVISLEAAASFQAKWDQLNATLDTGQAASSVFSESEATSRARTWLEERDAPISDLLICFEEGRGRASAKVDIPFVPGDADVLVSGTLLLIGTFPEAEIDEIDVGDLPGPLSDVVEGLIVQLIEDQTEELELERSYSVIFGDGEVTISSP